MEQPAVLLVQQAQSPSTEVQPSESFLYVPI